MGWHRGPGKPGVAYIPTRAELDAVNAKQRESAEARKRPQVKRKKKK